MPTLNFTGFVGGKENSMFLAPRPFREPSMNSHKVELAQRFHAAVNDRHLGDQLIDHVSPDFTAIITREKPQKLIVETSPEPKKLGWPKKAILELKLPLD
jgi:hypothetical protein